MRKVHNSPDPTVPTYTSSYIMTVGLVTIFINIDL